MVKAKKNTKKTDELPNQPIVVAIDTLPIAELTESKPLIQSDQQIIVELQNSQADLINIVLSVPKPEFYTFKDAIQYQDLWNKWNESRRLTWNKLNL
jgi:hypothetical protein